MTIAPSLRPGREIPQKIAVELGFPERGSKIVQ